MAKLVKEVLPEPVQKKYQFELTQDEVDFIKYSAAAIAKQDYVLSKRYGSQKHELRDDLTKTVRNLASTFESYDTGRAVFKPVY